MSIKENMTILFQGDSITDAGRNREDFFSIGYGYPKYIAEILTEKYPNYNLKFLNRGVSGDKTNNLLDRWDEDCISLKPDMVSILIGINDTWRRFDSNLPMSAEEFEKNYMDLLIQVKEKLNVPIVILEPFLLAETEPKIHWRIDLDPKIQVARKVAAKFGAIFIPLDGAFAAACCKKPISFWAPDGVHPNENGSLFIANEWIKAVDSHN